MGVSVSVERLRRWLLVGGGLLVAVIAAFLGYAHYRAHRFLTALPAKLGVDIRQETNGFTYSQSDGKRTIYTIHASKAVQHRDGRYTLHDVGIVLYGRKSDRTDRIYGSEFEYDQKEGVVRAMGEVHLDLQAPEAQSANAKMDYAAGKDLAGQHEVEGAHLIHVTTSGLVYLQKLGVAATEQPIEFEAGRMKGQAVGADYTADTGVLVLHSAVKVAGVERGQPAVLTASRADLDRDDHKVTLTDARYVSTGKSGEEIAQAGRAVAHLRSDGTVERLDAEGAVTLKNPDGGMVTAPRGAVVMNAKNEPQSAVLSGGLLYSADGPLRRAQGGAAEGRLGFDPDGKLKQAVLTGAVHLDEQVRSSAVGTPWNEQKLDAGMVELALDTDGRGKSRLRDAKATGNAVLAVVDRGGKGPAKGKAASAKKGKAKSAVSGPVSSSLAGDVLTAHFVERGGANHLAEVHGDGHASMRRVSATGVVETSSADSLAAIFQSARVEGKKSAKKTGVGGDEIASAVEQGHVVLTRQGVKKAGETAAPSEERATAERAAYDGALESTTLTGNVQVADADSALWADRVVANQKNGDAAAEGSVKVSYLQPKSAKGASGAEGPVHVVAGRADVKHDSGVTTFYGASGQRARLWQGTSQVEAPVIQLDKKQKRLVARGEGTGAPMAVHTVLTSAARAEKTGAKAGAAKARVFQVLSRELVYSDAKREADFTGGVRVTSADGVMEAPKAEVYLQPAHATADVTVAATHVSGVGHGAPASDSTHVSGTGHGAPDSTHVPGAEPFGKLRAGSGVSDSLSGFMGGSVERMVASGGIVVEQPGRRATGEQVVYTASDGTFTLTGTPGAPPKVVDEAHGTVTGTLLQFRAGDESIVVSNGGDSGAGRVRTETRVKKQR